MSAEQQRPSLPPVHGRSHRGFREMRTLSKAPQLLREGLVLKPRSERCPSSRPRTYHSLSVAESSVFLGNILFNFITFSRSSESTWAQPPREPPSLPATRLPLRAADPCSGGGGPPGSGAASFPRVSAGRPPPPSTFTAWHSSVVTCLISRSSYGP